MLQPTSAFKPKGFIDEALNSFIITQPDTLISVLKVPHEFNPHWVFEKDGSGLLKISTGDPSIIPRRQELPEAYYRDGSIYIISTNFFYVNKALVGGKTAFIESDPYYYCNLDTMQDWLTAEALLNRLANNYD